MFGHIWEYNFPSLANKRKCERCEHKQKVIYNINYKPDLSDFEVWVDEEKWQEAFNKNEEQKVKTINHEEIKRIEENYKKFKEIAKFEM